MTHYEVFRECFPELKLTEEHYDKLAEEKLCRAFELPEGFALVKETSSGCCACFRKSAVTVRERAFSASQRIISAAGVTSEWK